MEEKILSFIGILRKAGIKVSLVETLDCFRALKYIQWDKQTFYTTLRTTLIKNYEFDSLYEKLFNLFFTQEFFLHHEERSRINEVQCQGRQNNNMAGTDSECTQGNGGTSGQGRSSSPSNNFVTTILLGLESDLEQLVIQGIKDVGELTEKDLTDRKEVIRKIKVKLQWKMGEYELEKLMPDFNEVEKLRIKEKIAGIEAFLHNQLDLELINKFKAKALEEILKNTDLNELEFFQLSNNQTIEIKKKITKLAHRLATRVSRREVKTKKGTIKLSNTIRKAMSTGGVPICPIYKGKKPSRPQFIILCDLSGSVRLFSEFMLQLVYSIQSRFVDVRSFAFVDTVQEITPYFLKQDIEEAIKTIYYDGKFSKTGFSDYGQSLAFFNFHFSNLVTKKTTFLVLGDAKSNYQPPCLEELKKIKDDAHRVIWLNPAPKATWDSEDSIMQLYQQYCSQGHECRNLTQLEQTVKNIF